MANATNNSFQMPALSEQDNAQLNQAFTDSVFRSKVAESALNVYANGGVGGNGLTQGLSDAFLASPQASLDDSVGFLEGVGYFVGGSVVSGVLSLYNTLTALTTTIGVTDADAAVNIGDAIGSIFGDEASMFYQEHKTAIDMTGLVLGSIIPASLAIKGLRIAETTGILGKTLQTATGLKNADFIFGSIQAKRARAAVMAGKTFSWNRPAVYRAMARGVGQSVLENSAAALAVSATMNQSPAMGADDLGYFDAFWKTLDESMEPTMFFSVGGGVLNSFRIQAYLKREWNAASLMSSKNFSALLDVSTNNAGDLLAHSAAYRSRLMELRTAPPKEFADEESLGFFNRQLDDQDKLLDGYAQDILFKITGGHHPELARSALEEFRAKEFNATDFANKWIGALSAKKFSAGELNASIRTDRLQGVPGIILQDVPNLASLRSAKTVDDLFKQANTKQKNFLNQITRQFKLLAGDVRTNKEFQEEFLPEFFRRFGKATSKKDTLAASFFNKTGLSFSDVPIVLGNSVKDVSDESVDLYNAVAKLLGSPELDKKELAGMAFLQEVSRATSKKSGANIDLNSKVIDLLIGNDVDIEAGSATGKRAANIIESLKGEGGKVYSQLVKASFISAPDKLSNPLVTAIHRAGFSGVDTVGNTKLEKLVYAMNKREASTQLFDKVEDIFGNSAGKLTAEHMRLRNSVRELFSPKTLLREVDGYMAHPSTAEMAATKFPELAGFTNKFSSHYRSWNLSKRYFRIAEGQQVPHTLPSVMDLQGSEFVAGNTGKLRIPALNKTLYASKRNPFILFEELTAKHDTAFLDANAEFVLAHKQPLTHFLMGDEPMFNRIKKTLTANVKAANEVADKIRTAKMDAPDALKEIPAFSRFVASRRLGKIASTKFEDFEGPTYAIDSFDLPALERFVTDTTWDAEKINPAKMPNIIITDLGRVITGKTARRKLQDLLFYRKALLRKTLAKQGKSENYIAKYLNTSEEFARGDLTAPSNMMENVNFGKSNQAIVRYSPVHPADASATATSWNALKLRQSQATDEATQYAAEQLGDIFNALPLPAKMNKASLTLTGTESLTGMLKQTRGAPNSFIEMLNYAGKIFQGELSKSYEDVTHTLKPFYDLLRKNESQHLRTELSLMFNATRRDWYNYAHTNEGKLFLLREDLVGAAKANDTSVTEQLGEALTQKLAGYPKTSGTFTADELQTIKELSGNSALEVSEELTPLWQHIAAKTSQFKQGVRGAAALKGMNSSYVAGRVYPPKINLAQLKHFAFVTPTKIYEGADKRKFMVFADDAEKLQKKIDVIKREHGDKYFVHTKNESSEFKKLMGEYDRDLVFDSMYFDSSLSRTGEAAELKPSLDLGASAAMDDLQHMLHAGEKRRLKLAFEAYYGDTLETLKQLDRTKTLYEKAKHTKRLGFKDKDSVYAAVGKILFNEEPTGNAIDQLWTRINDYAGERGSELLNSALAPIIKKNRARKEGGEFSFSQEDLEKLNEKLESAGLTNPYKHVSDAVFGNTSRQNTGTLNTVTKAWAHIVAGFGLKLDPANNLIQLMSMPILLNPAIREALENTSPEGVENAATLIGNVTQKLPNSQMKIPSPMVMMMRGGKRFFTPEGKALAYEARRRHLINDMVSDFLQTADISDLEGLDSVSRAKGSIDKFINFGSKYTGYDFAEQYTRYICVDVAKQIADIRGLPEDEMFALASGLIDKVHGVYSISGRMGISRGVIGQAVAMYQNYFVNYMQNMIKYASDPSMGKFAIMEGLQAGIFGVQSLPGFHQLNQSLTQGEGKHFQDIFSVTETDEPGTIGDWLMYGAGSHALIFPMDFYSRGDMQIRRTTIFPTDVGQFPVVSVTADVIKNIGNTFSMIQDGAPLGAALLYGVAHNSLSRPLQGMAEIVQGFTANGHGSIYFDSDANVFDWSTISMKDAGAMASRVLGVQPLNEGILTDSYYRQEAYLSTIHDKVTALGAAIQVSAADGNLTGELSGDSMSEFANRYREIHGDMNNWNSYWTRQMSNAGEDVFDKMHDTLTSSSSGAGSAQRFMLMESNSLSKPWNFLAPAPSE